MKKPVVSVIVPVFNEEKVLGASYQRLKGVMTGMGVPYELIFINDGSRDKTLEQLTAINSSDENAKVISFSRNFGHQAAITAGMEYSSGDAVVVIDADLQDPPELIPKMVEKWREGYDVVYGKRAKRQGETAFKKVTASVYYRLLKSLTNVDIPVDTGDFRLIDRKVCDVMSSLSEHNRYVRGLVSWVGFKQCALEYVRDGRFAGETKYTLKKMLKLSMDGITAFSYKPLTAAQVLGAIVSAGGFVWLLVMLIRYLITGAASPGWAITVASVLLLQGILMIILGIIGEYLGRILEEVRDRPLYIVRESLGFSDKKPGI